MLCGSNQREVVRISRFFSTLMDFFTKRENGGDGHLEVLQAPGNSHNGDAEE